MKYDFFYFRKVMILDMFQRWKFLSCNMALHIFFSPGSEKRIKAFIYFLKINLEASK